jgi:hypothetical protein
MTDLKSRLRYRSTGVYDTREHAKETTETEAASPFTLRLDDALRVRIKRKAEKDGRTITGMMERLCSEALEQRDAARASNAKD